MRTRIGTRIIVGVALVTAATVGLMAIAIQRAHQHEMVAQLTRSADRLGKTIQASTRYDMLENRRESLHRQIETIGRLDGIERVRLFNKEGRIVFSSDGAETGASVDKRAEACYACHAVGEPLQRLDVPARARIYSGSNGHRVLGIIHPIHNEPACSEGACHVHPAQQSVLGVLDVNLSLADVDREIAASRARMIALVALTIAGSSALLWWLNRRLVIGPTRALLAGTRRVAAGDLGTVIPVTASHELGDLASAFNRMTETLAEDQRQITQADKLASVGRLAAGVAHEINNPLTGVLTYASFLAKRATADPDARRDLEVIVRETKRCREIVKGLLDFARHAPPLRQPTDLNVVVRRALAVLANQLAIRHVEVALDLAEGLPSLSADANQLQQVVLNLVLNAADASGDAGGTIRIATRASASEVELRVADAGCGIAPEHLPHLYEPFFSTKGTGGTGLGLAVTWGIVEGHGGRIEVSSEVGRGTRFAVRLPLAPALEPVGASA